MLDPAVARTTHFCALPQSVADSHRSSAPGIPVSANVQEAAHIEPTTVKQQWPLAHSLLRWHPSWLLSFATGFAGAAIGGGGGSGFGTAGGSTGFAHSSSTADEDRVEQRPITATVAIKKRRIRAVYEKCRRRGGEGRNRSQLAVRARLAQQLNSIYSVG